MSRHLCGNDGGAVKASLGNETLSSRKRKQNRLKNDAQVPKSKRTKSDVDTAGGILGFCEHFRFRVHVFKSKFSFSAAHFVLSEVFAVFASSPFPLGRVGCIDRGILCCVI